MSKKLKLIDLDKRTIIKSEHISTIYRTGKFSIKFYEHGVVIKPFRQPRVVFFNTELIALHSEIDDWLNRQELLRRL